MVEIESKFKKGRMRPYPNMDALLRLPIFQTPHISCASTKMK